MNTAIRLLAQPNLKEWNKIFAKELDAKFIIIVLKDKRNVDFEDWKDTKVVFAKLANKEHAFMKTRMNDLKEDNTKYQLFVIYLILNYYFNWI